MTFPSKHSVIDTFVHIPSHTEDPYSWLSPALGPQKPKNPGEMPVSFLFKGAPELPADVDPIEYVLDKMNEFNIERVLLDVSNPEGIGRKAIKMHPKRFAGTFAVDPNTGMESVRELEQAEKEIGVCAASAGPAFLHPQVAINDKKFYPLYAKCVELDIPICLTAGVPGPRVPMAPQEVSLLDEVLWFFPELKIVMRHGAEPWESLAVKLMLKWPNLYYSTSAFAPKHYPKAIIDYANTRGADKILYAGYFAVGLSFERIFSEFERVPFNDEVWPKFLYENAQRVFKL